MTDSFSLGKCLINPDAGEVTDAGGRLHHLSPRAMQLLIVFSEHPGEVLTREQLIKLAWSDHHIQPESIVPTISEIRQGLEDDPRHPEYIETSPGLGYRLLISPGAVADFRQHSLWQELQHRKVVRAATLYAVASFVLLQILDATSDALGLTPGTQRLILAAGIAGFPIVLLLAWYLETNRSGFRLDHSRITAKPDRKTEIYLLVGVVVVAALLIYQIFLTPQAPGRPIRIAVLPFNNFTGDPANEYLSDGFSEELLDRLQRYEGLAVLAHSATYYFKNRNVEFQTIAETLQADAIVEGSLLDRQGNRIRVVAQLIDGVTGAHKWSNVYDHELNDFLNIKHDVARKIASALSIELEDQPTSETQLPQDEQVYDLYLQGKDYLRRQITRQDQEIAEQLFLRALELDSSFTAALDGLCKIQLEMYVQSRNVSDYKKGTDTCEQLEAESIEAKVALGDLKRLSNEIDEAMVLYEQAIAANPQYEPAYYGISRTYESKKEFAAAEAYLQEGINADRAYWKAYAGYAGFLYRQGRYLDSAQQSKRVTELTPDNPVGWGNLGTAYFAADEWEAAATAWQQAFDLEPTRHGYGNLGTLFYYQHEFADARETLETGVLAYPGDHRLLSKLAAVYRHIDGMQTSSRIHYQQAFDITNSALEINADDAVLLAHHAYYAAAINNAAEANRAITRAAELQPNNPEVAYLNGYVDLLLDSGDWRDHVQKALEQGYSKRQAESDPMFRANPS